MCSQFLAFPSVSNVPDIKSPYDSIRLFNAHGVAGLNFIDEWNLHLSLLLCRCNSSTLYPLLELCFRSSGELWRRAFFCFVLEINRRHRAHQSADHAAVFFPPLPDIDQDYLYSLSDEQLSTARSKEKTKALDPVYRFNTNTLAAVGRSFQSGGSGGGDSSSSSSSSEAVNP